MGKEELRNVRIDSGGVTVTTTMTAVIVAFILLMMIIIAMTTTIGWNAMSVVLVKMKR